MLSYLKKLYAKHQQRKLGKLIHHLYQEPTHDYSKNFDYLLQTVSLLDYTVFKKHWNIYLASQYTLECLGTSIESFSDTVEQITVPLKSRQAYKRRITAFNPEYMSLLDYLIKKGKSTRLPHENIQHWQVLLRDLLYYLEERLKTHPDEKQMVMDTYSYYLRSASILMHDLLQLQHETLKEALRTWKSQWTLQ